MDNNIFEGANFGDKFITRDGRIALYLEATKKRTQPSRDFHILWVDKGHQNGLYGQLSYYPNGLCLLGCGPSIKEKLK